MMGRKSLETTKKQEVMHAFFKCIHEFGLEGTSLDQIAQKAGMTRSLVRHYAGNREEIIRDFIDYLIQIIQDEFTESLNQPCQSRKERLYSALFAPRNDFLMDKIVLDALINGKDRYPGVQERLANLFKFFLSRISEELHFEYPQMDEKQLQKLAYGLFCLSLSQDTMVWLGVISPSLQFGEALAQDLIQIAQNSSTMKPE
jgi:AcrR family transcriptional regulator